MYLNRINRDFPTKRSRIVNIKLILTINSSKGGMGSNLSD
nr:MAG TPA: hypothetical protein [Caudoviricetes sp.]